MTWRAFVGAWGDDHRGRWVDESGLTWAEARAKINAHAAGFEPPPEGCTSCYEQAGEVLLELAELDDGAEWSGDLEGEDMLLIREGGASEAVAKVEAQHAAGWVQRGPISPFGEVLRVQLFTSSTEQLALANGDTLNVQWATSGIWRS